MKLLPASVYALRASTVACVIVLSAMTATSCTSTVSSPGATAALAPSSDATTHTTESAMPSGGTQAITPEALALAGSTEPTALQAINQTAKPVNGKALPVTAATEAPKSAEQQTAAAAAPTQAAPVKTSLFGSSTPANTGETQVASAATAAAPVKTSLFGNPMRGEGDIQPKKTQQQAAEVPAADTDKTAAKSDAPASPEQGIATETTRPATAAKNNGALMRLFSNNLSKPAGKRLVAVIEPKSQPKLRAVNTPVQTASALPAASSFAGQTQYVSSSLPGVRPNAGIQIMQRDSLYDDDDVEAAAAPVILASAAGLARLAPNGLKVQRENVQVACLKPQLVGMLKSIERRYGKSVIVTSGYRSPPYNRLVNGAKASLHMSCAAADIQVPGVSKWELANFARSMSGRGGVGTYCHTESVHVDIGPTRDWNWRCSRRAG